MFTSTKRASRARRALAGLALAGAAAAAGTAFAPAGAGASAPKPSITVQVRHRTLYINGGRGDDRITLRVPAARPHVLAVDLGDDGKADAWILRKYFDRIVVHGGYGNDVLRIDETPGVNLPFTDTMPTSLHGAGRRRHPARRIRRRGPPRRLGRRRRRRQPGQRHRHAGHR